MLSLQNVGQTFSEFDQTVSRVELRITGQSLLLFTELSDYLTFYLSLPFGHCYFGPASE